MQVAGVALVALVEEFPASTWPPTLKLRRAKGLEERPESIRPPSLKLRRAKET